MKKFWKHKSKFVAIALVLLMASIALTAVQVQAQWYIDSEQYGMGRWGEDAENLQPNGGQRLPSGVTPDMEVKSDLYLSFRPNPVGVGQSILVNMWSIPGPSYTRYFTDYTVTITDPDGNEDVIKVDSYRADSTAWFEYVVDQVGTWTLQLDRPGQYFPAGNYTTPPPLSQAGYTESFTRSLYYTPASTPEFTLTVQEEMVLSWPPSALPTDYWTRPVHKEHREWWQILGNYPWRGPGGGDLWDELYPDTSPYWSSGFFGWDNQRFTPWVQGPETAHVAWKREGAFSGIHGGDWGYRSMTYGGGSPDIIYQGRCYRDFTGPGGEGLLRCYDIRTGEIYWETPVPTSQVEFFPGFFFTMASSPTFIEYGEGTPEVPGAEAAIGLTPSLGYIGGGRLLKFSPATGAVTVNVSIAPLSSGDYYMNGHALTVQTLSPVGGPGDFGTPTAGIYRLINWTTFGSTSNFANRVISNISWPRSDLGDMRDFESNIAFRAVETSWFDTPVTGFPFAFIPYDNATGFRYGTRIIAYSMKTGAELWDKEFVESVYHPSASIAQHGKIAMLMQDSATQNAGGYYLCIDQNTGNVLWKSEQMDYPWDIGGFGAYGIATAYGMFIRFAYSGVYAFNWDDGSMVWKYEAPGFSPYESPYIDEDGNTMYSFNAGGMIADGKVYAYNTEHTTSQPITRGWGVHCINATTGELIWKTKIWGSVGPIADGYLPVSGYDGYEYVFGKGRSTTTIEAPLTAIAEGQSIVLRGTVLDMSPAQPETPCVSKESMSTWMEYLHLQMPIDGLWHNETITGVPVSLDTLDPNGNFIHIADVTTDGYSGTYGYTWTPEIPGTYAVMATFMGDESYGSSFAQTTVGVVEAPEPPTEPAVQEDIDQLEEDIDSKIDSLNNSLMPILYVLIVAVVVVAILVVYTLWTVRKR